MEKEHIKEYIGEPSDLLDNECYQDFMEYKKIKVIVKGLILKGGKK